MGRSVLDDLGEEITGIISPVTVCMVVTIALVRLLNPNGASDSTAVYIAQLYYNEQEADSAARKLSGSIINAAIFVSFIGLMTFLLVLLFKHGYTRVIHAYMCFAGFSIFFVLVGIIAIQVLQKEGGHMDWISFVYILFNFAAIGAATLFFAPAPLLLKQSYLVITGVATAFVFTWIPEWTTWILLGAMSVYDIVAVLTPAGPLQMLVQMAEEREEEIPALVYQARPVERRNTRRHRIQEISTENDALMRSDSDHNEVAGSMLGRESTTYTTERRSSSHGSDICHVHHAHDAHADAPHTEESAEREPYSDDILLTRPVAHEHETNRLLSSSQGPMDDATSSIDMQHAASDTFELPEAIKLGLGDFIFYSLLMGRASMYDWLTVAVCYIAIIAGLGLTLLWLAVSHHALPALPVSIALAMLFYFAGRFVIEPVILPSTLHLAFF